MEQLLSKNVMADFSGLKNGEYWFTIPGAYDETASVRLILWGRSPKFRKACFDLIRTAWEIKESECRRFGDEWSRDIRAVACGLKIPCGRSQITFEIPRHQDGEWLYRAAQFVSNINNLERLDPV